MQSEGWNIIENTSLCSTSLYDYFHSLSVQLMRIIRLQPHNIATYDIRGIGLQQVAAMELYGLFPPVTINCCRDFNGVQNMESNLRLRIIDWNHRDGGLGTVEATWSGDLSCDQILELLQHHRINLMWQHIFTNNSDYQDEDYCYVIEGGGAQEAHDTQEIERVPDNLEDISYHLFITLNLSLQSGQELEIFMFDDDENVAVENPDRGAPPAAKSTVESLARATVCQNQVDSGAALCVICREMVCVEESARQLPCKHMYHSQCILPWLSVRNSCPICRYELPTDDPHYELQRKLQHGGDI